MAVVIPEGTELERAVDALLAVAWYLPHSPFCEIVVLADRTADVIEPAVTIRSDVDDRAVREVVQAWRHWDWREFDDTDRMVAEVVDLGATTRILVCPREVAKGLRPAPADCKDLIFWPATEASSSSLLAYLGLALFPGQDEWLLQSKGIVDRLQAESGPWERAAVFGTGPSFSDLDWSASTESRNIICNSAVKQVANFDAINPVAICAADPVFHSSYSRYAGEFRDHLVQALRKADTPFVFPLRDLPVYYKQLPDDVHSQFCPVPLVESEHFNLNLKQTLEVKSTANVLTLLMLPLAFTISNLVEIAGCDGKPQSSDYFWNHSPDAQFGSRMDNVKDLFPGFFNIDFDQYYETHCRTLGAILSQAESEGRQIRATTSSFIPALAKRESSRVRAERIWQQCDPVDELGCLARSLIVSNPVGIGIRELPGARVGLKEYLNRNVGPGYAVSWQRELPCVAVFDERNFAPELVVSELPDVVVVSEVDSPADYSDLEDLYSLVALSWVSASSPGERRRLRAIAELPVAKGRRSGSANEHRLVLGARSKAFSLLFRNVVLAEMRR